MRPEFVRATVIDPGARRVQLLNWVTLFSCVLLLSAFFGGVSSALAQDAAGSDTVHFDSSGASIAAFLAQPQGGGAKHPAVILIHDNQGLTDGVRDMAKQFASEGFLVLAPDLLSRAGGSKNPQQSRGMISQLDNQVTEQDLQAAFAYLQKRQDVDPSKISSVGLGWGGWRSFMMASTIPELYRAVIYSGATPVHGLETVKAPVMANYAQFDFFDAGNSIWTQNTLKEMGKQFTYYVYPNVYAAFFDATSGRYNAEAAKLAWTRTLDFLKS
jgi:carboxymethylenebutenolidase